MSVINDLVAFVPAPGWYAIIIKDEDPVFWPLAGWAHIGSLPTERVQNPPQIVGVISPPGGLALVDESDPSFLAYSPTAPAGADPEIDPLDTIG